MVPIPSDRSLALPGAAIRMLRGVAEGAQLLRQRRSVDPVGIHIKHLAVEEVRQVFGLPVQSRYFSRPLRLLRRWLLAGCGWL